MTGPVYALMLDVEQTSFELRGIERLHKRHRQRADSEQKRANQLYFQVERVQARIAGLNEAIDALAKADGIEPVTLAEMRAAAKEEIEHGHR